MIFTQRRAELIKILYDGEAPALPILHSIDNFFPRRREDIYNWLLARGIKGKKLVDFYFEEGCSMLNIYKRIIPPMDKKNRGEVFTSNL